MKRKEKKHCSHLLKTGKQNLINRFLVRITKLLRHGLYRIRSCTLLSLQFQSTDRYKENLLILLKHRLTLYRKVLLTNFQERHYRQIFRKDFTHKFPRKTFIKLQNSCRFVPSHLDCDKFTSVFS